MMEQSENPRNTFDILRGENSGKNNIFLLNIPMWHNMNSENYKILESLKDGSAKEGK